MISYSKNIFFISAVAIINLCLLFFIKYYQNNLSLFEYSFIKTGNLICIILTLIFLIGVFLLYNRKQNLSVINVRILVTFSIFYVIPIIVLLIFSIVQFKFADEYLFGYPLKKIIPLILFSLNQIIFLFVLYQVWFMYLKNSIITYFYSTISVVFTIISLVIFSFIYTFFPNQYNFKKNETKFTYGIILGAAVWSGNKPSPIFMGRIDKGAALYKSGKISKIQLTGGNAPGELSEAETALKHLRLEHGIPEKDILIEKITSTTNEQIQFIKNKLEKNKNENFLIISDEFHLKRIEEMSNFYNLNASVISSGYKLNFQKSFFYRLRDSIGIIIFWFFAL